MQCSSTLTDAYWLFSLPETGGSRSSTNSNRAMTAHVEPLVAEEGGSRAKLKWI